MVQDLEVLSRFYRRILKSPNLSGVFIPRSDVHYVRNAIHERTGELYELEHVAIAMWFEGFLPVNEIAKIPDWYVDKYMNGVQPDMVELKKTVAEKYRKFLKKDRIKV